MLLFADFSLQPGGLLPLHAAGSPMEVFRLDADQGGKDAGSQKTQAVVDSGQNNRPWAYELVRACRARKPSICFSTSPSVSISLGQTTHSHPYSGYRVVCKGFA